MPVDLYVGGPEHAVGHLLYSRMWNRYLYDKGLSPVEEPFKKLVHQGMILGSNKMKMGKRYPEYSVNPNDVVEKYGADTLRMYEMFMGPLEVDKPWSNEGIEGTSRFLDRIYRLYTETNKISEKENTNLDKIYNQTVKKVSEDFETLNFNTAISQMMIFINAVYKEEVFPKKYALNFLKLLNPVCPFISEELWNMLGNENTITYEKWPLFDENALKDNTVKIAVQINGKVRDIVEVELDSSKEDVLLAAKNLEKIKKFIEDKEIIKEIVVPNKAINIVVK